jgi:hypothetical protein
MTKTKTKTILLKNKTSLTYLNKKLILTIK